MSGVTINIFLSVDSGFEKQIIDLSLKLRNEYDLDYYVDGKRFYPHLSLLGLYVLESSLKEIVEMAEVFFSKHEKLKISTNDVFCSSSGILMLRIEKNEQLFNIHKQTLDTFNTYRQGLINEKYQNQDYLQNLSKKDRDLISKYGSKWVLDNYDPHITFARLKNKDDFNSIKSDCETILSRRAISANTVKITREYFGEDNRSELTFEQHLA